MEKIKLKTGSNRNQCPGCGELFNSLAAFDRHRHARKPEMLYPGTDDWPGYDQELLQCEFMIEPVIMLYRTELNCMMIGCNCSEL